jgi:putative molybdopterin biosynthesis protein
MLERRRYLRRLELGLARERWLALPVVRRLTMAERVSSPDARGRVTASPVHAVRSVPHYHCAAMDGVALRAALTFGASESRPRRLTAEEFVVVDTGDPIPAEADAVVMIEQVSWLPDGALELIEPATPWQHVRLAGEDLVATEMVLPSGHLLRPVDIAALLSCGVRELEVRRRPVVAVIPTGDELVDALAPRSEQDLPGAILETNSHLIAGLVEEWGGVARRGAIVPDRRDAVRQALLVAAETADLVAMNAGSSAGREDFVPAIMQEEGELIAHGVDVMPGKPVALGAVRGVPVIAVPGYPVSAWVVCEEFLRSALRAKLGLPPEVVESIPAAMGRKTASRVGTEELVRVAAGRVGERRVVVPLPRGASLLSSVVRADGVVRIPAALEGVDAGEPVQLEPRRPAWEIDQRLLAVGSHDLLLDLLADLLARADPCLGMSSAHVGSLAGLVALQRGECHLAGTHLIDEATGQYNLSWVGRFFPAGDVTLIRLAGRQQGLLVRQGNPRGIASLADLHRSDVVYVNRQRGSGTRQLLDYLLRREGLAPERVAGYHRELYTHLAVASAIQTGGADCGLAILAVARALDLEFIPVAMEQYDLAIRRDAVELPSMRKLLSLLDTPEFRARVEALGGYDLSETGRVLL